MKTYGIFDIKTARYLPPFYAVTHGHAIRMFTDHTNERGTPLNLHPEDYQLFHLGDFNDELGVFENRPRPEPLAQAIEVINKQAPAQLDITDAINRKLGKAS